MGLHFLSFWPFGPLFFFILAFWAFISFHFGLLGLDFLSFWPFGPLFPFILVFWAFISFHFGLLGLHFLSLRPISFHFWLVWAATWGATHKMPKTARFLMKFKQILSAPRPAAFCNFWPFGPSFPFIFAFWAFISFHFGLLGLHFLSFWPFGLSFPFILAFSAFISFHFGLLGLHFLHFWLAWAATWGPPHKLPKTARFLMKFKQILSTPRPAAFCNFWPFGPSFPFILAFWAFISFHFGLLGLHFLSFWPFGPSFPFILAFWAFIFFHFGLLGLHFLSFWPFGPSFPSFWPFGLSFPFILAFWAFISFHFGLLGFHFLAFLVCLGCHVGSPPQVAKNGPFPNEI